MTRHVQGVEVGYATYAPWRFVRAHGGDHIVVNRSATPQRYPASVRMTHHVQGAEVGCVKSHSAAVRTRSRRQSHSRQTRRHPAVASWRSHGQNSIPHSGLGMRDHAPRLGRVGWVRQGWVGGGAGGGWARAPSFCNRSGLGGGGVFCLRLPFSKQASPMDAS